MMKTEIGDIDSYMAEFPEGTRKFLEEIRSVIKKTAPEATEAMKYGIPTFVFHGNLVHFAGYKSHVGFYPAPSGITRFKKEISVYKNAKGSVQFPLDQPLPLDLIRRIVEFRMKENLEKTVKNKI